MKNVIEFPDRAKIKEEAIEWLIKLDGDAPSKRDLAALKEWIARSPAHLEELEKINALWGDLSVLTELNIPLVKPAVLAMGEPSPSVAGTVKAWLTQPTWAMAASVLAMALLLQQLLLPTWFGGPAMDATNGHYATAIGKQATIPLADGSSVHLNTNSQIRVDYTDGHRNIHLVQGQAHFDVAKNKALPFRVYAGKGRVQAVGTAFTVYLREQDVDVLVTEGKVALATQMAVPPDEPAADVRPVSASTESAQGQLAAANDPEYYLAIPVEQLGLLTEGQGTTLVLAQSNESDSLEGVQKLKPMAADSIERRDAWRKGLLLFAGDTLEDVVAEVSRYTTITIEIVDPALKKIRIGGQFRVGDVDAMFDVFEENFGLRVTMLGKDRVQISMADKNKNTK